MLFRSVRGPTSLPPTHSPLLHVSLSSSSLFLLPPFPPSFPAFQTNMEIMGEMDFGKLLQQEEEYVEKLCGDIIALKPDLVITEKGVSGGWSLPRVY